MLPLCPQATQESVRNQVKAFLADEVPKRTPEAAMKLKARITHMTDQELAGVETEFTAAEVVLFVEALLGPTGAHGQHKEQAWVA